MMKSEKMKSITKLDLFASLIMLFISAFTVLAQTGGTYDLSHNVVAGGGCSQSSGGSFILSGTVGQPLAGTFSFGGTFNLRAGFWAFASNTPTAATVSIQGEITSLSGKPLNGMTIILLDTFTNRTRTTMTNEKGRYRFEDLEINHLYVIKIRENKLFTFTPESQIVELMSNLTDINFTAIEIPTE